MTDITLKKNDTPWALAVAYTGKGNNWPAFCKANPQFKTDPTNGCTFFAGNVAHLPADWVTTPSGSPVAPIPGPVPQPVGPAVTTPTQVIDLDAPENTVAPASSSFFADPKKVMIAGGIVAGAIAVVYAIKKSKAAKAA